MDPLEILRENNETIGILMPCRPQHDVYFKYIRGRKHSGNLFDETARIFGVNLEKLFEEQYDIMDKKIAEPEKR